MEIGKQWPKFANLFKNQSNANVILSELPFKYLFIGGCMAFLVNVASFGTVKRTSATAMGVMANVCVSIDWLIICNICMIHVW